MGCADGIVIPFKEYVPSEHKQKKLKAHWSLEAAQDLIAFWDGGDMSDFGHEKPSPKPTPPQEAKLFAETECPEVVKRLTDKVFALVPGDDYIIAGGAIRDRLAGDVAIKDIDLFFNHPDNRDLAAKHLEGIGWTLTKKGKAQKNFAWDAVHPQGKFKLDLVYHQWATCSKGCLEDFDFTCCCVTLDRHGKKLQHHVDALKHIEQKILVVNACPNPVSMMDHFQRLVLKGYRMDRVEAKKFMKLVKQWDDEKGHGEIES